MLSFPVCSVVFLSFLNCLGFFGFCFAFSLFFFKKILFFYYSILSEIKGYIFVWVDLERIQLYGVCKNNHIFSSLMLNIEVITLKTFFNTNENLHDNV